jgi:hypothetical protein
MYDEMLSHDEELDEALPGLDEEAEDEEVEMPEEELSEDELI